MKQTTKQIAMLLGMLFVAFPGYGDTWDDLYQAELESIQRRLDISPKRGFQTASDYAWGCYKYVMGFVDGGIVSGNPQERNSRRFAEWRESWYELQEKLEHFVGIGDYGNAAYYAKKLHELNCQYENTLIREN